MPKPVGGDDSQSVSTPVGKVVACNVYCSCTVADSYSDGSILANVPNVGLRRFGPGSWNFFPGQAPSQSGTGPFAPDAKAFAACVASANHARNVAPDVSAAVTEIVREAKAQLHSTLDCIKEQHELVQKATTSMDLTMQETAEIIQDVRRKVTDVHGFLATPMAAHTLDATGFKEPKLRQPVLEERGICCTSTRPIDVEVTPDPRGYNPASVDQVFTRPTMPSLQAIQEADCQDAICPPSRERSDALELQPSAPLAPVVQTPPVVPPVPRPSQSSSQSEGLVRNDSKASIGSRRPSLSFEKSMEVVKESLSLYQKSLQQDAQLPSLSQRLRRMEKDQLDLTIDSVIAVFICFNALSIGVSMDSEEGYWLYVDIAFTVIFLVELSMKLMLHGFKGQFCGPSALSNIFDASLIFIDLLQLVIGLMMRYSLFGDVVPASMFRVVRLVRMARLIRLLRLDALTDLLSMISGMVGGMTTLAWSMVLFMMFVYVTSLILRESFGRSPVTVNGEDLTAYFDGVPRSMLTTFRCFFGDCTTIDGLGLIEAILDHYGGVYAAFVCLVMFIVTIGLFNVISAIFVESTMVAAMSLQQEKRSQRLNDETLWAMQVGVLVQTMLEYNGNISPGEDLGAIMGVLESVDVAECRFDQWVRDQKVIAALNSLDILPDDHKYLFDILDNDNTGSIKVTQLVDGLKRLRGEKD
eukprot:TRINITY_DN11030_c0_g1_i1.p1 TRINITY_DN11030_c0_g1~~TRINITY_DN11030_c0_g1_i1.p1  ORF type:complete len:696 (-),score=123.33 TRINITY_DN11030_c0_g1_i1:132-2219(-)